jgi:2-dehydro-3-deoxyphosphogluconate aldolase/(4S)-4-hydroxy-2-oxoglutarate aldolase
MTGNTRWTIDNRIDAVDAILTRAPVVPVLSIANLEAAVPLARALVDAGLPVLEVTLRTGVAREAIRAIAAGVPDAIVGAGTVLTPQDLGAVAQAGAKFAIAPGCTETMYGASRDVEIPFIPAIATASELMRGLEHGHARFKFFPAESAGGVGALRSFAGPFAQAKFCPTGGIDAAKARDYLRLPNVVTVGGSWMVPGNLLAARDWNAIGALASACIGLRS